MTLTKGFKEGREVLESCLFLIVAKLMQGLVFRKPEIFAVVGSDYGQTIDSNCRAIAMALIHAGRQVVFISNIKDPELDGCLCLKRGSYEASAYILRAEVILYTHSLSDVLPKGHWLMALKKALKLPIMIFLQHGIIGLKSQLSNGASMRDYILSLEPTFDYMVVSSKQEMQLIENMGVSSKKLALTGLARFDRYDRYDLSKLSKRNVLIFFTWQNAQEEKNKIDQVLSSKAIKILIAQGFEIKVQRHKMSTRAIDQGIEDMSSIGEVLSLELLIDSCALLITDDSSVAWDLLYLDKDVLFYQPSENWLLSKKLFEGRFCESQNELEDRVQEFCSAGLTPINVEVSEYSDRNNCARIIEFIDK